MRQGSGALFVRPRAPPSSGCPLPHEGEETAATAYFPVNTGFRFSTNAAMPSFWGGLFVALPRGPAQRTAGASTTQCEESAN